MSDLHWAIVLETHRDETNQMWGKVLAYCGTWQKGEGKAHEAAYTIAPEGEINGRLVTAFRSMTALEPGDTTKICF